ncbi:hypothetical protein FRB99_005078 [Tulasnella sp. 403]|nr:hypothetical protein FRB99_005078 [Tulasnella sp. 403]
MGYDDEPIQSAILSRALTYTTLRDDQPATSSHHPHHPMPTTPQVHPLRRPILRHSISAACIDTQLRCSQSPPPSHPSLVPTVPEDIPTSGPSSLPHMRFRSQYAPSPSPVPESAPLARIEVLSNVQGYASSAFLPPIPDYLKAHWEKRMQLLKSQSQNEGVSSFEGLRSNGGGLDRTVNPKQGERVLAQIERIPSPQLLEAAVKWHHNALPQCVHLHPLYLNRPDLFLKPEHARNPDDPTAYSTKYIWDSDAGSSNEDLSSHLVDPYHKWVRRDERARQLVDHHPDAVPLPQGVSELELQLDPRRILFTLPSRDFLTAPFHVPSKRPRLEPTPSMLASLDGSNGDTDTESEGPPTPRIPQRRLPPSSSLGQLGALGSGLGTMSELQVSLDESIADLKAAEHAKAKRRSRPRAMSTASADSDDSQWSMTTRGYLSDLTTVLRQSLLATAASILHVSEPNHVDPDWTWLDPREVNLVLKRIRAGSAPPSRFLAKGKEKILHDAASLATSTTKVSPSPSVESISDGEGDCNIFTNGSLRGWDCFVWGRKPGRPGLEGGYRPKRTCFGFVQDNFDACNSTGSIAMLIAVQPPWLLPIQTFEDFTQSQEFTDGARGEESFLNFEALWATMHDACQTLGIYHFAVTSYTHIAFGSFTRSYQTGYISQPYATGHPAPTNPNNPIVPLTMPRMNDSGQLMPNALQLLMYWMRTSMGNCTEAWVTPDEPAVVWEKQGQQIMNRERLWRFNRREQAAAPSNRSVSRTLNGLIRKVGTVFPDDVDDDDAIFVAARKAQVSQRVDWQAVYNGTAIEVPRRNGRGIKRRYTSRERDQGSGSNEENDEREIELHWVSGGSRERGIVNLPGTPETKKRKVVDGWDANSADHEEIEVESLLDDHPHTGSFASSNRRLRKCAKKDDPIVRPGVCQALADDIFADAGDKINKVHLRLRIDKDGPRAPPSLLDPFDFRAPPRPQSPDHQELFIGDSPAALDMELVLDERPDRSPRYRDPTTGRIYRPFGSHLVELCTWTDDGMEGVEDSDVSHTATDTESRTATGSKTTQTTPVDSVEFDQHDMGIQTRSRTRGRSVSYDAHTRAELSEATPAPERRLRYTTPFARGAAGAAAGTRATTSKPRLVKDLPRRSTRGKSVAFMEDDDGRTSMDLDGDAYDRDVTPVPGFAEPPACLGEEDLNGTYARSIPFPLMHDSPSAMPPPRRSNRKVIAPARLVIGPELSPLPVPMLRERSKTPTPQIAGQRRRWAALDDDDDDSDDDDGRLRGSVPTKRLRRSTPGPTTAKMISPAPDRRGRLGMSTPRAKKARTDTGSTPAPAGGLALPPPASAAGTTAGKTTPAVTPAVGYTVPQMAIDPALQGVTALGTAVAVSTTPAVTPVATGTTTATTGTSGSAAAAAAAAAAANKVAQASSGYLNSGATPIGSYAYPQSYYSTYYPQYAAGTSGMQYYPQYAQAYQTQQYGTTPLSTAAAGGAAAYGTVAAAAAAATATSVAAAQRLIPPTAPVGTTTTAMVGTPAKPSPAAAPAPALDTSSVAQLTDALGSAGVDIRAEEEAMARDAPSATHAAGVKSEDRSKKQNFLDPVVLAARVKEITTNHSLTASADAQTYIALALQFRLTTLVKQCISAVDHRIDSNYNRPPPLYPIDENANTEDPQEPLPMWGVLVRRDVAKQLAALEKIEREEETRIRRRRRERDENEAAGIAPGPGDLDGEGGGGGEDDEEGGKKKKKKKKDGPGVTAKNMSDEVRKKMSDMVANDFAGGFAKKYAWMQGGAASTTVPKPAATTPKPATATSTPTAVGTTSTTGGGGSGFVRPFVTSRTGVVDPPDERKVTLADLMFVINKERGHGAGRGSARTWSVGGY